MTISDIQPEGGPVTVRNHLVWGKVETEAQIRDDDHQRDWYVPNAFVAVVSYSQGSGNVTFMQMRRLRPYPPDAPPWQQVTDGLTLVTDRWDWSVNDPVFELIEEAREAAVKYVKALESEVG